MSFNNSKASSPSGKAKVGLLPSSLAGSQPSVTLKHMLKKQTNETGATSMSKPGFRTNYNSTHSNLGQVPGQGTTSVNPSMTAYKTLNQNVMSKYNLRQQQNANSSHHQLQTTKTKPFKSTGNTKIMIKTQCVSLEVSPDRETGQPLTLQGKLLVKDGHMGKTNAAGKLPSPLNSKGIKIIRKPIISHTMKNSKQPSLNSTPTRQKEFKHVEAVKPTAANQREQAIKAQNSQFIQTSQGASTGPALIPPDGMYSLQFTRNTQANAKTVSNVAHVLHNAPGHQPALSVSNKPMSAALSLDNHSQQAPRIPDQDGSRLGSQYTSLTNLNSKGAGKTNQPLNHASIPVKNVQRDAANEKTPTQHQSSKNVYNSTNKITPYKIKTHSKLKSGNASTMAHNLGMASPISNNDHKSKALMTPGHLVHRLPERQQVSSDKKALHVLSSQKYKMPSQQNLDPSVRSNLKLTSQSNNVLTKISLSKGVGVSKTAQASTYNSKNNSNNSSVVRAKDFETNPTMVQNNGMGSRLNKIIKKNKHTSTMSMKQQHDVNHQNQGKVMLNLGASGLSYKTSKLATNQASTPSSTTLMTKQIGASTGGITSPLKKPQYGVATSTTKANLYATSGQKSGKTQAIKNKQASGGIKSTAAMASTLSSNYLSMSHTTIKGKKDQKQQPNSFATKDLKRREPETEHFKHKVKEHRRLTFSNNSPADGRNVTVPLSKPVSNHPSDHNNSVNEGASSVEGRATGLFNSNLSSYGQPQKKKFQPSQGKTNVSQKEGYRRAGYQSASIVSNNNGRPGEITTNPLVSFNEIQEEVKETESTHNLRMPQPTFNITDRLMRQTQEIHQQQMQLNTAEQMNISQDSTLVQLQEYKKDILKLKKMIKMYFQQHGQMQQSSCNFYRIGRVLGRGAFGKVNLACHKVTEHLVAIKALEKKVLDSEKDTKKRVMQEIAILKQSNHCNVVRLYDSFETHKHICFVMELCQGGDLLSYVRKRRKLKEDNAKYLFKQLIEGLDYIHTQKFVLHRDIKLDNILLDAQGQIKICDFGVSRQVKSERERMFDQCGTPAYIAPEILNKKKGYKGFKSDMWSAGVCLYVMLFGTVPFRASTMHELHQLIRKGKYSLQGEVLSNDAKNLIASLINVNPHKRLSAAETLQHPWFTNNQEGAERMDYERSDLAQIIFTKKELETIQKEYITRLEKLKRVREKKSHRTYHDENRQLKQNTNNDMVAVHSLSEEDLLFTEHNLDTREDQQEFINASNKYSNMFNQKQTNSEFQKFEGLIIKKNPAAASGEFTAKQYTVNVEKTPLKNVSEKSIIFCPFNSSQSGFDEDRPELFDWPDSVKELLEPKKSKIIKFSKKCRDLNREYEGNNNADLDNGVFNAFINEQEAEAEKLKEENKLNKDEEQVKTQDMESSGSFGGSVSMSSYSSDAMQAMANINPDNSLVQSEIKIHESMQKGHEVNWQGQMKKGEEVMPVTRKSVIHVNSSLMDHTARLFKCPNEQQQSICDQMKLQLDANLATQELNYLTAAYYLCAKHDIIDE